MESHTRLTEMHIIQARLRALRLFAFTSAVFPGEWSDNWGELIVPDLLEFGFHTRKVNEFCNLNDSDFSSINKKIVKISDSNPEDWEENYCHALNKLMHMKSFVISHAHADHRIVFTNAASNLIATYIKVSTDKFPETTISIVGNCGVLSHAGNITGQRQKS